MAREDGAKAGRRIGPLIKRYRQSLHMTQHELSATAGISVGALRGELTHPWREDDSLRLPRRPDPEERPTGARINILGPLTVWRSAVG